MKVFCGHCLNDQLYRVEQHLVSKKFRNITVEYYETVAYCQNCGHQVYVEEIEEKNQVAYQDAYCRAKGLVELSIVRDIPIKYSIGIRPLSKLLGWGDLTYTRYYDGCIPTKHYSDELIKLYNEPRYFLKKLQTNKTAIANCAYKKAYATTIGLINDAEEKNQQQNTLTIKCTNEKNDFVAQNTTTLSLVGCSQPMYIMGVAA